MVRKAKKVPVPKAKGKQNIINLLKEASPEEIEEGLMWYQKTHEFAQQLSYRYGFTIEQTSAVIAVISPRVHWVKNMEWAEEIIKATYEGREPKTGILRNNQNKALNILKGDDIVPKNLRPGTKTFNFWQNILSPACDCVTIDVHALNIIFGKVLDPRIYDKLLYKQNRYNDLADIYREAAAEVGLTPSQAQAISWVRWRHLI